MEGWPLWAGVRRQLYSWLRRGRRLRVARRKGRVVAGIPVGIALPTSILSVESTLFLKSLRVHQVARVSSIFGVESVFFYREYSTPLEEYRRHRELIEALWRYFFTPPYLRRRLVPRNPLLRYVGALPPIRLQAFDVKGKPTRGEVRAAYITLKEDGVTALLDNTEEYKATGECSPGITMVRVVDTVERIAECINGDYYMGPKLFFSNSLKRILEDAESSVFKLATDKTGAVPSLRELRKLRGRRILVLFGSPKRDLYEISAGEGFSILDYADAVWNTIPGQNVVSVRTEEAVAATLSLLNYFLALS